MSKKLLSLLLGNARVGILSLHILMGLLTTVVLRVALGARWFDQRSGKAIVRMWARMAAFFIGLRIYVMGKPISGGLRVVNHISWLDIIALNSIDCMRFVSKEEVKAWPAVGKLAEASGTFFLRRHSPHAAKDCLNNIAHTLESGHSIAVFPEGTTSDGAQVLHFHGTFFQAAIDSRCDIQPIALEYRRDGTRDWLAPYINDDTFLPHMFRLVCTLQTTVVLNFLEPVKPQTQHRKILAERCRQEICQALLTPTPPDFAEKETPVGDSLVVNGEKAA